MKKSLSFVMFLFVALFSLVGCGNGDNPKYDKNQKVNAGDVPWEVSMGINDYGDRALMIKFTNNSKYVITELSFVQASSELEAMQIMKEYAERQMQKQKDKGAEM